MKVGDVIDERYLLKQTLGEGGIVQTFKSVDQTNDNKVIVKRLDPDLGVDSDVVERLVFEAQTVGGMGSEFIATVLGTGSTGEGIPYLVTEHVEGSELSVIMKRERRPFAPQRAVTLTQQLCRGVGAAHKHGVLHLGLRPEKLLVSRQGGGKERLRILDFGFARVREMLFEDNPSLLTGPPYYTAPEMLQETQEVDHRADVYSVGVILYQLLTSKVPFQAESFDDLVVLVATTNPRKPRDLRPNLKAELEAVVLRAIARKADHRYANMEELAEALAPFAGVTLTSTPPESDEPAPPGPSEEKQVASAETQEAPAKAQAPETPETSGTSRDEAPPPPIVPPPAAVPAKEPPPRATPLPAAQAPAEPPPRATPIPAAQAPAEPPSPAPPPRAEPPRVAPPKAEPAKPPHQEGPTETPPWDESREDKAAPQEPPRVAEPPRVERKQEPAGEETPPEAGSAPKPEPKLRASERAVLEAAAPKAEPKLRASERAVLEAGTMVAGQEPPSSPQAEAAPKKSPLLRILLIVVIIGVLGGAAVTGVVLFLPRGGEEGGHVTAPPQEPTPAKSPQEPPEPTKVEVPEKAPPPPPAEEPEPVQEESLENSWVSISGVRGRAVILGVSSDRLPAKIRGFRPALGVRAPSHDFEIQQHEVTWGELGPWLMSNAMHHVEPPSWLPEIGAALFPATSVRWNIAQAFCQSQGGALPSEVEWELAARGHETRPNPWGAPSIELEKTHAYRARSPLSKVMTSTQDVTPGDPEQALFDMAGNALEWTADPYRNDGSRSSEGSLEVVEGATYRTVRGLPPADEHPGHVQAAAAAHRLALCAEGPCPPETDEILSYVGFRCVRRPADAPTTSRFAPPIKQETAPAAGSRPQKRRTGPIAPNPYR